MQAINAHEVRSWHHRALPFLPVLIAIVAFLYMMDQHSRKQQAEAEQKELMAIASSLGLPLTATREEVYACVRAYADEHEVAKRAFIAEKVGLDVNWKHIFDRIEKMKPEEREKALKLITAQYHLPDNMPIGGVRKNVSMRGEFTRADAAVIGRPNLQLMKTAD